MIDVAHAHSTGTQNRITALLHEGQSVWQDDLNRTQLVSGELQRAIADIGIRGLTSNPTIFAKAINGGAVYDEQLAALLDDGNDAAAAFEAAAVQDVRDACDLFRPLYDETDGGDGFVSIEVSPGVARDPVATRAEVRRLWAAVSRPNVMIKIPGTVEAVPVIEEMLAAGININITLLFSLASYERVALAYVAALETRLAAGQPIDHVASVASFFVSRIDTLVDTLLDAAIAVNRDATEKGRLATLKGKAAVANARLAYAMFQDVFEGSRFAPLLTAGARVQRPLWASTSVKNPAYPDTMYGDGLIGPHTVNTMPRATIDAFRDHGLVRRTVDKDLEEARRISRELGEAGIDLETVARVLEEEGITLFTRSYNDLLRVIDAVPTNLPSPRAPQQDRWEVIAAHRS